MSEWMNKCSRTEREGGRERERERVRYWEGGKERERGSVPSERTHSSGCD